MYLKINTLENCPNCKKSSVITGKNWVKNQRAFAKNGQRIEVYFFVVLIEIIPTF
jgi:hypothetical protein